MDRTRRSSLPILALLAVILMAGIIYFTRLETTPPHVSGDEAHFAVHALALAATGRDDNGTALPLFFHLTDPVRPERRTEAWWQPMLFYSMAAALRVAPLSAMTIRMVVAVVALVNIVLIYAVARRWFSSAWYGVLAAALLALTPAHVMLGRQATDYFLPLPFVLAWLFALPRCVASAGVWMPALTGVMLGVGLYSYVASWIVMPALLLVTHGVLWRAAKARAAQAALALGFVAALLPLGPWLTEHPSMFSDMLTNYHLRGGPRIFQRIDIYWQHFSPSYLLFSGGADWKWATTQFGVFAVAFGVFVPLGVRAVWSAPASSLRWVLLFGFLFSPLPVVLTLPEAPGAVIARQIMLLPFGVLLAVAGVDWMLSRGRFARGVAAFLLIAIAYQFSTFARHYFGPYRAGAAPRFDELNLREVAGEVSAAERHLPVPAVYFSSETSAAQATQWRFHVLSQGRPDLWTRTRFLEVPEFCRGEIERGSVLVMTMRDAETTRLAEHENCSALKVVKNIGGAPASTLVRRE